MAIAIDGSSPAIVTNTSGTTATITTASFTPVDGSVLLVSWSGNSQSGTNPSAPTITDSLGVPLTYTLINSSVRNDNPQVDGQAAMWRAVVGTGVSMTVTVTNGASSGNRQSALKVYVLTGVDTADPDGAVGESGSASTSAISAVYSATATNSQGFIVDSDWDVAGPQSPGSGMTNDGSANVGTAITYGFMRRTTPDGVSGNNTTQGVTLGGTSTNVRWVFVEIKPAVVAADPDTFVRRFRGPRIGPTGRFRPWTGYLDTVATDVSVSAECATGTGSADNAVASIAPNADAATGTGISNDATASVAPTGDVATGTGVASDGSIAITVNADVATGTGTAGDPTPAVAVNADAATGSGVANDATVSTTSDVSVSAECATGTGAAGDPTVAIAVNADVSAGTGLAGDTTPAVGAAPTGATGTGAADNASIAIQVSGDMATGTGAAQDPTPAVAVIGDQATGTGAALDPTVSTQTITNAPAEVASGTGAANDSSIAITVIGDAASGSGSAPDPGARIAPSADVAAGTGTANNATILTGAEPPAGNAAGSGTALDPTVAVFVYAECAIGVGDAYEPLLVKPVLPYFDLSGGLGVRAMDQNSLAAAGADSTDRVVGQVDPSARGSGAVDSGQTVATGLS